VADGRRLPSPDNRPLESAGTDHAPECPAKKLVIKDNLYTINVYTTVPPEGIVT
jgi:hypothetical protein